MTKQSVGLSSIRYLFAVAITAAVFWTFSYRTQSTEATVPPPIAVVDVNKVLTQSKAGKAAYDSLKLLQDQHLQKARERQTEIDNLEKAYSSTKATMSEAKLAEAVKVIADKRIAAKRYAQDAERDIGEARDRTLAGLDQKAKPVINAIGKEMGLVLVFNKFESGLVYASDAVDITDVIITRLNATIP